AVVGDQEGAAADDEEADGAAPDLGAGRVDHEAGHEVLVAAAGASAGERDAHDLVAGAQGAVPGAVEGDEGVAAVGGGERGPGVEAAAERGGVRLEEDVGDDRLGDQVGAGAAHARLDVA